MNSRPEFFVLRARMRSLRKIYNTRLDTDFELSELSVAQILAFTIYDGDCIESSTNPIVTGVLYAQNIYQGVSTS